jgi:hypothetical protein
VDLLLLLLLPMLLSSPAASFIAAVHSLEYRGFMCDSCKDPGVFAIRFWITD